MCVKVEVGEGEDAQAAKASRAKNERKMQSDAALVNDVRTYMKANKLSQVTVGQEARISQAVISQWLSLKYHGHNDKARPPQPTTTHPPQNPPPRCLSLSLSLSVSLSLTLCARVVLV